MALWRIQRFEVENPDSTPLTCLGGEHPVKVTLRDDDTGAVQVVEACIKDDTAPCDPVNGVLKMLFDGGYTPNDWNSECGF